MDQTSVHLVPVDTHTYETKGAAEVRVIGADDKRQITACIASSPHGDLLPLQLIFAGKTDKCLPPTSPAMTDASVHLTFSENHWSSQQTMQQYIQRVLIPYAKERIVEHKLSPDSKLILVLDIWAVHKSMEFRTFLKNQHPNIHLVFVPANCTSKLQVADVMLQRPFKHGIKRRFNEWAAEMIKEQIAADALVGLTPYLKMSSLKPLIVQWCIDSWKRMKEGKDLIKTGWHTCVVSLFDVYDGIKRVEAVAESARGELEVRDYVPSGEEKEDLCSSGEDTDDDKDELDIMKERRFGTRRSTRKRAQPKPFGFSINPSQVDMVESGDDSDADGMS